MLETELEMNGRDEGGECEETSMMLASMEAHYYQRMQGPHPP